MLAAAAVVATCSFISRGRRVRDVCACGINWTVAVAVRSKICLDGGETATGFDG